MQDPLDPLKKIQAHLDAIRRAQQFSNPIPKPPPGSVRFEFTSHGVAIAGPMPPPVPDPLVEWLLEDLPPRAFHDLVTETLTRQKIKGYRPGHVPRDEGLKMLQKRYDKEPPFRAQAGAL